MADKPVNSQFKRTSGHSRSYLLGLILGIFLVILNLTVGVMIINFLRAKPETRLINSSQLPLINTQNYMEVKKDFNDRLEFDLINPGNKDPFKTN